CFYFSLALRALHSFPTRRSSDLAAGCSLHAKVDASLSYGTTRIVVGQITSQAIGVIAATIIARARVAVEKAVLPFRVLVVAGDRSEEHTSELQSRENLVCRLLLE